MVTVKVWSDMSATPITAGPVWNSVRKPPTDSIIVLCAGQNWAGVQDTVFASSHSYVPVRAGVDFIPRARSTTDRFETGFLNVTTTGWPTPTTAPSAGAIDS